MKPIDFWITQIAFFAYFIVIVFFSNRGPLLLLVLVPYLWVILAKQSLIQKETLKQKTTSVALLTVFLAVALPLTWGQSKAKFIAAGLIGGLISLVWHLRQKTDTPTPVTN